MEIKDSLSCATKGMGRVFGLKRKVTANGFVILGPATLFAKAPSRIGSVGIVAKNDRFPLC